MRKRFAKQKMKSTKERHTRMDFFKIKSICSPIDIGKKTKPKRPSIGRKYLQNMDICVKGFISRICKVLLELNS